MTLSTIFRCNALSNNKPRTSFVFVVESAKGFASYDPRPLRGFAMSPIGTFQLSVETQINAI